MIEMTKEELEKIIENHQHWLNEDCEGWERMKANLSNVHLGKADLRGVNLIGADLRGAFLYRADLRYANLRGAYLYNADLTGADLSNADLRHADLRSTHLKYARLYDVDLDDADLRDANLYDVDLEGVKNIPNIPYACPDKGSFIGYKKANVYIVELEILPDAQRCSATGRKCRCDKAKVLSITNLDGSKADVEEICSDYNSSFIYKVGEIVEEPKFNKDRWNECSEGIHFFINRQEAVDYRC